LAKKQEGRKRRTREHVIADLSRNHVERFASLAGYATSVPASDYGTDLNVYTFAQDGQVENGYVSIQLKATDAPNYLSDGEHVSFPVERAHLESWLREPSPVILVLYDALREKAYWLYVQRYFEQAEGFELASAGRTVAVRLRVEDVMSVEAIRSFRTFKERVLAQAQGTIHHA
jgi:hypothetical protein